MMMLATHSGTSGELDMVTSWLTVIPDTGPGILHVCTCSGARGPRQGLCRPGQKVSTSTRPSVLEAHGRHEHYPEVRPPLAVVFAASVTDVQEGLARCREHHVPVISFGVVGQHGPLEPRVRPY